MDIRHTKFNENSLISIVDAATTVDAFSKHDNNDTDGLSGLPSGHPIRVMMEKAKINYEESIKKKEFNINKIKKVKKVDNSVENYKNIDNINVSIGSINEKLDGIISQVVDLLKNIDNSVELNKNLKLKVNVNRLKRFLNASIAGCNECKINKIRY